MAKGGWEVGLHHPLEDSGEGVDIGRLAAQLPTSHIQDVTPVEDQDQDASLASPPPTPFLGRERKCPQWQEVLLQNSDGEPVICQDRLHDMPALTRP